MCGCAVLEQSLLCEQAGQFAVVAVRTSEGFEGLHERAIRATRVVGAATRFPFEGVMRCLSDRIARETFEDCVSKEGGARAMREGGARTVREGRARRANKRRFECWRLARVWCDEGCVDEATRAFPSHCHITSPVIIACEFGGIKT